MGNELCSLRHDFAEQILQIFYACILRIARCAGICVCGICKELQIFFFDCLENRWDSNVCGQLLNSINRCFSVLFLRHFVYTCNAHGTCDFTVFLTGALLVVFHNDRKHHGTCNTVWGIIRLASQTGLPIIPVCIEYESCWRLNKAWDHYAIPKPGSNVNILWKKRLFIPPGITDEQVAEYGRLLAGMMQEGVPDFPPLTQSKLCKSSTES